VSETTTHEEITRFLGSRVAEGWMPGAAWWVEARGRVVSRGATGLAQCEPLAATAGEDTPYDAASLTKPLATGLLLALLEGEGVLDGAEPVERWIEEARGTPLAAVSLLELARHEGGLPAWGPLYLRSRDRSGYLRQIASSARSADRGRCIYSDLGYIALGVALERALDVSLDRSFDGRIARPLGLPRAGFLGNGRTFADAAATERGNAYERTLAGQAGESFAWREGVIRGEVHDGNAWGLGGVAGHAGLFLTAEEAATIAREMLAPRRLALGPRGRTSLLVAPSPGARSAGFVPAARSSAARGILPDVSPGHTGFTGTSLWLEPTVGGIYVLLTNRVHPVVARRDFQRLRRAFHRIVQRAIGVA
jgi:CubicO group peptidase (beta-lactamase class C family)